MTFNRTMTPPPRAGGFGRITVLLFIFIIFGVGLTLGALYINGTLQSAVAFIHAFSSHEANQDIKNLTKAFPETMGTRLENCQLCHGGGSVTYNDKESPGRSKVIDNACSYCHIRVFEKESRYFNGYPASYQDTLNEFGKAYLNAGKSKEAFLAIAGLDSDNDGYSNEDEIKNNRYPGDPDSRPNQPLAPTKELTWELVASLPYHEQFMLFNTTNQQYDEYATYGGVRIKELLKAAGVDLKGATGFTVFAPDGYRMDFQFADFDYLGRFPNGKYYKVPTFKNPDRELIKEPEKIPNGLRDGGDLTNQRMILAFKRDGDLLEKARYDSETGRIKGEGPYRIVRPQKRLTTAGEPDSLSKPGRPDRGSKTKAYHDGWDFLGFDYDHNAGDAVMGSCIIRIDPMPKGFEEYDWKNGWNLIKDKKIIVYGQGVQ